MPSFEEHRQKCDSAQSAQLALQAADSNIYADWIVIAAFYQALHWHQDNSVPPPFLVCFAFYSEMLYTCAIPVGLTQLNTQNQH